MFVARGSRELVSRRSPLPDTCLLVSSRAAVDIAIDPTT